MSKNDKSAFWLEHVGIVKSLLNEELIAYESTDSSEATVEGIHEAADQIIKYFEQKFEELKRSFQNDSNRRKDD